MKKLFATYEIAKKLKELGFDEPCLGRWNRHAVQDGKIVPDIICIITPKNSEIANSSLIAAPTWQQTIDWLREEHNIVVMVRRDWDKGKFMGWECVLEEEDGYTDWGTHKTYYEALNKAIEESLILITK